MNIVRRHPEVGYLDCALWVPKAHVNIDGTKNALTFQTFDQQKVLFLTLWKETEHHLIVPREFFDVATLDFPVIDCRPRRYEQVGIHSRIQLDHEQQEGRLVPNGKTTQREAMGALQRARGGVLQLACGSGKTVVALDLIAREKVPALIILDTVQLMKQWKEQIELFLNIPDGVGLIQGNVFDWKKPLVLATYHTLAARAHELPEEVRRWFGWIIFEESHHLGATTFARTADLFYGKRLGLTATPYRDDGMHVVYDFHLGPVLYKNLKQELTPRICFLWTGLSLDNEDPVVTGAINDKNGELHIGKVASYFGQWRKRLDFVIEQVRKYATEGRKILVLSKSVDELVNLFAIWNGNSTLYTDIPFPTSEDVGEELEPRELNLPDLVKVQKTLGHTRNLLKKVPREKNYESLRTKQQALEQLLAQHVVYKKCEALWNKRRGPYLKTLLAQPSTAGLMIYKVDADHARRMLKSQQVTFAIMKYGKEGLDERSLDTILVSEPISKKGGLQQLMGRALRPKEGKKEPLVVFLEDDIGPFIGMCKKLRKYLREWSPDEGGPFNYELLGYPQQKRNTWNRTTTVRAPGT